MSQELPIKLAVDAWHNNVARTGKLLNELTDSQIAADAAPGRNSGTYLLGHLTAVHDRLIPLLGFGDQLHPELNDVFLASPDKSGKEMPSVATLRDQWKEVNETLAGHMNKLPMGDWMNKHTSVSEEDFAKEPHRNRLNVLISRTNHLCEHLGQLLYLKK